MKLYSIHIRETGENLCVAARSADHAAEVLVTFWCARSGTMPGRFYITAGAPPLYKGDTLVRRIARGKLAGVIIRQLDGTMIFEPAIT
ncbi:hypothetical protein [Tsuneonella troitsensis]|uniref:hypothetical protein n=1 Tax=Tsuneonella troitsensis TaxID=292222 RepID=UPI00070D3BF5|nr:hypothetical protein [Tsuneonella troitsensis]